MPHTPDTGERWNVPISALEHYAYCPRQAVLIWQEAYFESNADTVPGDLAHAAVDRGGKLTGRAGATIWRSLPIHHHELGTHGICDTVHWTTAGPTSAASVLRDRRESQPPGVAGRTDEAAGPLGHPTDVGRTELRRAADTG